MPSTLKSIAHLLLIILLIVSTWSQLANPSRIHIQSRKFSAISGQQAQTKVTPQRVNYTVPYARAFIKKPDIGLSVYNLQFDYNPQFSINVIQQTSTTTNFQFYVSGRPSQTNIYNQLFIMYIASDYDQLGIYMPGPKNTTAKLGIPSSVLNRSQQFTFNFKNIGAQPIFPSNTNTGNIKVTVYLTGIQAFSQTIQNGYSKNYAYFSLSVSPTITSRFYTIVVNVKSSGGDVLIKVIQFTVVYFDITKIAQQYQMNSNSVVSSNFGGTFFKSSYSTALQSLPQLPGYQNTLQYFFGISEIQCSQGQTINLLAVQRFNYNNNGKLQNLLLTFETQRNTYIRRGVYNYIQYKPRQCNDSASCGIPCGDPNQPSYRITNLENRCAPCLYFCLACQNGFNCTTCPPSRSLAPNSLCVCINRTLYDDQASRECQQCFDTNFCNTCQRKGVCQTCYNNYNFTYNNVLRTCECSAGTYNSVFGVRNTSTLLSRIQSICLSCPQNCIYCVNSTSCQACEVPTYLALNTRQYNTKPITCSYICNQSQQFDYLSRGCKPYNGDISLFDQAGRLGFDWEYKNINNQLVVDLLLSQSNMSYYFYQNGKGYQYITTSTNTTQTTNSGQSQFYYDDGNGYIGGYSGIGKSAFQHTIINTENLRQSGSGYIFDQSALNGQYYGLGQAKFFSQEYKKYQPSAQYFDKYNIPFGKHKLKTTNISDTATFIDAIRNNLLFIIDGQSLPYTIRALSGNQFQLIVRPQKSYLKSNASIIFKNPALVRSQQTALQTPIVTKQIDRLDYYTQNQLTTALSLRDRTATIVQILWGICKYILFIGFGWSVMPLMLILQYIFGHNYITSQLPLNLDYFLTSFADFRNPSILFNPQRNQFDRQVVNHPQIYKRVAAYQQFDRGIDFMKNSFQFFFTPLLSFALLFLFIFINKIILNKICKRDFTLVSKFLQPRAFHHGAAYTLVQALPIAFFFFGQLLDQRYRHRLAPNSVYPSFNAGMSYASFFASAIIPLVLLTGIYNYFKNKARSGTFSLTKAKGTDSIDIVSKDPAMIGDPLWGGNPYKPMSYGFGAAIFYLPLLVGFFLSFFTKSYPWQLTGLLLGHAGVGSFAAGSHHFDNKIPKFFWAGISALMVGYQLVHAGVGSNRALSTYDQWNTGYLGIGIIYALLLAGIIFSGYLLYKLFTNLYKNIIVPFGCFPKIGQKLKNNKSPQDQQQNLRDKALGRDQIRKSTIAQSRINYLHSQDRLLNRQNTLNDINLHANHNMPAFTQQLLLQNDLPDGRALFKAKDSGQQFLFPFWSSAMLKRNMPLLINSQNKIYNGNGQILLGTVPRLMATNKQIQSEQQIMIGGGGRPNPTKTNIQMITISNKKLMNQNSDLNQAYQMVKNNKNSQRSFNFININGQQFNYDQDQMGNFYIVNYNGKSKNQMSQNQFYSTFSNNKNKIMYQNKQYYIQKTQDNSNFYYLTDPITMQRVLKISKQNLHNLFNQNKKIMSTSLLKSNKQLQMKQKRQPQFQVQQQQQQQQQEYVQYRPGPSNKSIIYTKQLQQYLINGKTYQKIGEDIQYIYFNNVDNGQKLQMKKSQAKIRSQLIEQRGGSLKQMIETRLNNNNQDGIMYQGQKYIYKGKNNNNNTYNFMNVNNGIMRYFTVEQIAQFMGYKPTDMQFRNIDNIVNNMGNNIINNSNNNNNMNLNLNTNNMINLQQGQMKSQKIVSHRNIQQQDIVYYQDRVPLKLMQTNHQRGLYVFQNPNNGQVYQIPLQCIDINENVYVDKQQNIWHKNEMLAIDSQQQSQQSSNKHDQVVFNTQNRPNRPNTQNSLPSSSSQLSLSQNINNNHYYHVKMLSPDYAYSNQKLPSAKDILQVREGVKGTGVSDIVEQMRRINPYGKIFIESLNNPSQKMIIQ